DPKKAGLWRIPPNGEPVRLVAGAAVHGEVSPDGQYVLYHYFASGRGDVLSVVRVADGKSKDIAGNFGGSGPTPIAMGRGRWMPDGKAVVFCGRDEKGHYVLFRQDFAFDRDTSASRRVAASDPSYVAESHGISPDGSAVVVAETEAMTAISIAE